jgi:hypothetical protein
LGRSLVLARCPGGLPQDVERDVAGEPVPRPSCELEQRRGVGSLLMEVFRAQVDASGEEAYLETDKPGNVLFYERFGFEVISEQDVLGVPNWFMLRRTH